MDIQFYQVDAFASKPFGGNQAAVVPLDQFLSDEIMQKIGNENNLAETAFLVRTPKGFDLRWFTPEVEVDLCGHATLASAHILFEQNFLKADERAVFHTKSGELVVQKRGAWLEMDFPALMGEAVTLPGPLGKALHAEPLAMEESKIFYLVEVESPAVLRSMKPDFGVMKDFKPVIATARGGDGSGYDFISRVFGPGVGINEDPVTGSAHCHLATYWNKKLKKDQFVAYQASARGGEMRVHLKGDRVLLTGQAVTVIEGVLKI